MLARTRITRKALWLTGMVLLAGAVRAEAPAPAPEVLVAEAAALYASIAYGPQDEERAIADLAAALRQDPANRQARDLLAAIQKRREERRKKEEQAGQRQIEEQSRQGRQAQRRPRPQPSGKRQQEKDKGKSPQQQSPDRMARKKPDEGAQTPDRRAGTMSRAEAERLLDALQQQERRPSQRRPARGNGPNGPQW